MKEKLLNKIRMIDSELVENCGISLDHVFVKLDSTIQENSYYTDIGERYITIYAQTEAFLFYGLLGLLQKVKTREILKIGLSTSVINERGLHVDCGRKHYTKRWFMNMIELMALNKMNSLQIHVSENLGYRLESKHYPEITSIEHLSNQDISDILDYAKLFYVDVIPSFNVISHLEYVLQFFPEYALPNSPKNLDITKPDAIDFSKKLLDEIIEIFDGIKTIHIGADEYFEFLNEKDLSYIQGDNDPYELVINTINSFASNLLQRGFNVRVWNDGFYRMNYEGSAKLDSEIDIAYWTSWDKSMAPVSTFIEHGHKLINFNDNYLYYVLGEKAGYRYPSAKKIENNFNPFLFSKGSGDIPQVVQDEDAKSVIGSYISIWSDAPEAKSEDEIYDDMESIFEAFMNQLWKFTPDL